MFANTTHICWLTGGLWPCVQTGTASSQLQKVITMKVTESARGKSQIGELTPLSTL